MLKEYFTLPKVLKYPENDDYTEFLSDCIDSGIKTIEYSDVVAQDGTAYAIRVTFGNNVVGQFWNNELYEGWLRSAMFTWGDNPINREKFTDQRPSRYQMSRFLKLLDNRHLKEFKPTPFSMVTGKINNYR